MDESPKRKSMRLADFNYSWPSAYAVTICAADHRIVFGEVLDGILCPSSWGEAAIDYWKAIPEMWSPVELDEFALMPNHFHGILLFPDMGVKLPNLGTVVNWYKGTVTKSIRRQQQAKGIVVWQRSYYDHVIRDEQDLAQKREYITLNPGRWEEDEYYRRNTKS